MRVLVAHALAVLVAPFGALFGVLLFAAAIGQLTLWRDANGGSGRMFSIRVGLGLPWQISRVLER